MEQEYKYMVVTRCFTFNHASYIVDAMNGFTMQETTFPVITLIVDDASTDGEPEVIKEYLADHFQTPYRIEETDDYHLICTNHNTNPNCTFVVLLLKYNHYSIKKSKFPYLTEWLDNAKYHALCEGDDWWIDSGKLQKQVVAMEKNEDVGLVYGIAKQYIERDTQYGSNIGQKINQKEDLIYSNCIPTLTVMYRSGLEKGFDRVRKPEWRMGDYPLWMWIVFRSSCEFINEPLGVYRVLETSASHHKELSPRIEFQKSAYDIQCFFSNYFNIGDLSKLYDNHISTLFDLSFIHGDSVRMRHYYNNIKKKSIEQRIKMLINSQSILRRIYDKKKLN